MADSTFNVVGRDETVVLLDYTDGPKRIRQLIRITAQRHEVWRVRPPDTACDAWTEARIEGDEIVAYPWSGFGAPFDLDPREERSRTFANEREICWRSPYRANAIRASLWP